MIAVLKKISDVFILSGIPRRSLFIIFVSSIVTIFFEILGIGVFIPIFEILSNSNSEFDLFGKKIILQSYDKKNLYYGIALGLLFIMSAKSIVLILNSYLMAKFWSLVNEKISLNVYKNILGLNYKAFTKKSNSTFSNVVVVEAEKFTELTKYVITFLVESFILLLLFALLLSYDFISSLFILLFLIICIIIIYLLFKGKISKWGTERQKHQDSLQNNVKSGLMSYLSININGGLSYFINNVELSLSKRNSFIRRQFVYENIPRSFLELAGISVLLLTALILYNMVNLSFNEILSYTGVLGITFYRILPSFNRLVTSYNQINFLKVVLDAIKKYVDSSQINLHDKELISFKSTLKFENVSFEYAKNKKVLHKISFTLNKGDILGVFGKSGVGKSTLLKILLGIIKPTSGNVKIDSIDLNKDKILRTNRLFGYVEQNVRIFSAKFYENITISKSIPEEKLDWYNKVVDLCQLKVLDKTIRNENLIEDGHNLSGGQIQRIGLARALFNNPDILVLDEFTSALDQENKDKIVESLMQINKSMGTTIVLISHDQSLKSITNKIVEL